MDGVIGIQSDCFSRCPCVFPDGQVPAAAGAGPATLPRDRGGVEEDAPGQEEETEGQRGEGEGKETREQTKKITRQELIKALRGMKKKIGDKEKRGGAETRRRAGID